MPIFGKKRNLLTDSIPISDMPREQQKELHDKRMNAPKPVITEESLIKANETLRKYKEQKASLEARIVKEEEIWKLNQWKYYQQADGELKPKSAWLFNCIISKLADIMDGYPEANLLPKMPDDEQEARVLSEIMPVILRENGFETTYNAVSLYTLQHGGGVYGVFWDGKKNDGLGDISIRKVDLLNLYWRGGVTDIQESPNVFHTTLIDNEQLMQMYPELRGTFSGKTISQAKYLYDENIDTENMSVVVDWYYRTNKDRQKQLHYCKFVDNKVLFASENEPEKFPNGWYAHGDYPFIHQALFPVEGSICGMGYIAVGYDTQQYIDTLDSAILKNSIAACRPRHVFNGGAGINEAEFNDWTKDIIHAEGNLGEDAFRTLEAAPLPNVYVEVRNNLIEQLKETTGNRDVNNGGTTPGVTAASAIAAMQEQSGKVSRTHNQVFYTTFERVITQCIELIRQFYDQPRQFRIVSDIGQSAFIQYDNSSLRGQQQSVGGIELGLRKPEFDIEVSAQKSNTYNKMSQNELAIQLFGMGVFNPQMANQAMALLKAMDFNHKEDIAQTVSQNGTMYQMLLQFQQIALSLAQKYEPNLAQQIANMILQFGGQPSLPQTGGGIPQTDAMGSIKPQEHPFVEKARNEAQQSTQAN